MTEPHQSTQSTNQLEADRKANSRLPRRLDWGTRMSAFISDTRNTGHQLDWENVHCLSWVFQALYQIVDYDFNKDVAGEAHTPTEAYAIIRKMGFENLDEAISAYFDEIPVTFAQKGDLLLVKTPLGQDGMGMPHALALADPPIYWALDERGLGTGSLYQDAHKAFAVGTR